MSEREPTATDGDLYFTSGLAMRKSRDLAARGAAPVTDGPTLEVVAARYREGGWPAEVAGDALTAPFSAPSAGPPPWYVYRFTPAAVTAVATSEPPGATRWTC